MIKSFLTILFMITSVYSFSQEVKYTPLDQRTRDSLTNEAGDEMARFSKNISIGTGLILFGGVLCIAAPKVAKDPSIMFGAGALLIIVGGVMSLSAPNHIANAATLMQYSSGFSRKSKGRRSKEADAILIQ